MSEEPLNITMARMSSGPEQYMTVFTATRAVTLAYHTSKVMNLLSSHNNRIKLQVEGAKEKERAEERGS